MKVTFSAASRLDLIRIGEWIAQDNRERSITFVEQLVVACHEIGEHPRIYPVVPGTRSLRKKLFSPYLIFFRERRGAVVIVSVRHGARDNRALR